jgi:hypothetical protein
MQARHHAMVEVLEQLLLMQSVAVKVDGWSYESELHYHSSSPPRQHHSLHHLCFPVLLPMVK